MILVHGLFAIASLSLHGAFLCVTKIKIVVSVKSSGGRGVFENTPKNDT